MSVKRFIGFCSILFILAVLTACNNEPQTLKVAVSAPMGRSVGEDMVNGVQLALDEAGGKVGDISIELVIINTSDPEGSPVSNDLEREGAQSIVDDEAVIAYLGPLSSGQARESIPILNEAGIPQISYTASWPGLTKPGYNPGEPGIYYPTGKRTFFRIVPSDDVQGEVAARWAHELGFQTAYIVDDSSNFGSGLTGIFELTASDVGLELIGRSSFVTETATEEVFVAIAEKVIASQPDFVYYGGSGVDGAPFLKALWALDPEMQVMGADPFVAGIDDITNITGLEQAFGLLATNLGVPPQELETQAGQAFVTNFERAYEYEAPPFGAAGGYESMNVVLQAIANAEEPTRAGVLEAIRTMSNFDGIYGDWTFDDKGDMSIVVISGMQFTEDSEWVFEGVLK